VEFAKSLFVDGTDVSPLSWEILRLKKRHYFADCSILLQQFTARDIEVSLRTFVEAVSIYGRKSREHLIPFLTCPVLPVYYPTQTVGWDEYTEGYMEFLRLAAGWKSLKWTDTLGMFRRLTSDPLRAYSISPWKNSMGNMMKRRPGPMFMTLESFKETTNARGFLIGEGWVACNPALASRGVCPYMFEPQLRTTDDSRSQLETLRKEVPVTAATRLADKAYSWEMWSWVWYLHQNQTQVTKRAVK
jgi:hypothetical protein